MSSQSVPQAYPAGATPGRAYSRAQRALAFGRGISANAYPGPPFLRGLDKRLQRLAGPIDSAFVYVRESAPARQWRFVLVLTCLSFLTAWAATRALMVGFESSLTQATLATVRHENDELRARQEALREATAEALARLEASETTYAANR